MSRPTEIAPGLTAEVLETDRGVRLALEVTSLDTLYLDAEQIDRLFWTCTDALGARKKDDRRIRQDG